MLSPTYRSSSLLSEVLEAPTRERCPKRWTDHLVLVTGYT